MQTRQQPFGGITHQAFIMNDAFFVMIELSSHVGQQLQQLVLVLGRLDACKVVMCVVFRWWRNSDKYILYSSIVSTGMKTYAWQYRSCSATRAPFRVVPAGSRCRCFSSWLLKVATLSNYLLLYLFTKSNPIFYWYHQLHDLLATVVDLFFFWLDGRWKCHVNLF